MEGQRLARKMAFVLILFGAILFVTAYQGTTGTLGSMLMQDLLGTQGKAGFVYWIVAIGVVGAIGYIKSLKGLSDAFIGLLLLVLFISNKGFFAKFNQAIASIGTSAGTQASGIGSASSLQLGASNLQSIFTPAISTSPFGTLSQTEVGGITVAP